MLLQVAEYLVQRDGDFLIRDSLSSPGCYVLTCQWRNAAQHFKINKKVNLKTKQALELSAKWPEAAVVNLSLRCISPAGGDAERSLLQSRVPAGEGRVRQRPRAHTVLCRQQKVGLPGAFGQIFYTITTIIQWGPRRETETTCLVSRGVFCVLGGGGHHLPADQQGAAAPLLGGKVRPVQPPPGRAHGAGEAQPEAPQPQRHQRTRAGRRARRAERRARPGRRREPKQPAQVGTPAGKQTHADSRQMTRAEFAVSRQTHTENV